MSGIEAQKGEKSSGYIHKQQIYNFIAEHIEGVTPSEISRCATIKGSQLSRQVRSTYLQQLKHEKKVYKKNGLYFAVDLDLGVIKKFADCMARTFLSLIDTDLIDFSPDEEIKQRHTVFGPSPPDSYIEFLQSGCGISVSKEFCKTKFNKETSNQKYVFEFVNRIGAYITYIFIESLRALLDTSEFEESSTEKKTKTVLKRRASISYNLIHKSIDFDTVFEHFYEHIIRSFRPSSRYPNTKTYAELINEASNIFKKVYPKIPDILEKNWQNEVAGHTNWLDARREAGVICDHEWNEIHIFKLPGKYYFCRKCSDLIDNTYRQQIS